VLTIGALAELAGTTTRTVRHYHAVGVLPEPARRANGYREYDLSDVVRLLRVRRLVALGLSLPEVADALRADDPHEHELRDVLRDLDAELARQEDRVRRRRQHVAELLARDGDLTVSADVAALLRDIGASAPGVPAEAVARERELLEMVEAARGAEGFALVAAGYRAVLDDAELVRLTTSLAPRFEALATVDAGAPEVEELARDLAAMPVPKDGTDTTDDAAAGDEAAWAQVWAAFLATLAPAQARCLERVVELRS
jgi:DNA-binding transcriptional MerR regulator